MAVVWRCAQVCFQLAHLRRVVLGSYLAAAAEQFVHAAVYAAGWTAAVLCTFVKLGTCCAGRASGSTYRRQLRLLVVCGAY